MNTSTYTDESPGQVCRSLKTLTGRLIMLTLPEYSTEKDQYLDIGAVPVVKTGY
ncbi:hypothetical protein [Methanosarcina horonobensis]|uniref:hypothetical protein n=1 Tax=Methanosarcina horonobensis TaxID=418008 RepID=UPI00138E33E2|nr:hypothetical protein [Methanosarcina horonobensis]